MKKKLTSGFTLVEGMVVIVILGIFATILVVIGFVIHHFW